MIGYAEQGRSLGDADGEQFLLSCLNCFNDNTIIVKMNKLILSIAYAGIVLGIVWIVQYTGLPSPFDWLLILLAVVVLVRFFPPLGNSHTPVQDIFNDIGTFDDQLIYLGQFLLTPGLAYAAVWMGSMADHFGWGIPAGLAALALLGMAGLSVMKREAHTRAVHTVGEAYWPIIYVHYSRRKAIFPLFMAAIFTLILAAMLLFLYNLKGELPAHLMLWPKVSGGLILVGLIWSARDMRRLKHKAPVLTLHPYYLQYQPLGKPVEAKNWEEITGISLVESGNKGRLLLQMHDGTSSYWPVEGLGMTRRSAHQLIQHYAENYARSAKPYKGDEWAGEQLV